MHMDHIRIHWSFKYGIYCVEMQICIIDPVTLFLPLTLMISVGDYDLLPDLTWPHLVVFEVNLPFIIDLQCERL